MEKSSTSIQEKAKKGAAWVIFGVGASQILRFINNLILARLLAPEFFGLMAIVNTILIGLNLFSDTGLIYNIVQHKDGDKPEFYNTAWTIQVVRGWLLWVICLGIAWPMASFYEEPRLLWLLPVCGLTTVIDGFKSTAIPLLKRNLSLAKETRFDASMLSIAMVFRIVWALISPTIWALVGGQILGSVVKTVRSFWLMPGIKNRITWNRQAARDIFLSGRWIFLSTALTFMANQADRLILGKLLNFELLGIYGIAFIMSDIPRLLITKLGNSIIFPLISIYQEEPRSVLREKILKMRLQILLAAIVTLPFLVTFGDVVIHILYDERYSAAGWMFSVFSLALWPTLLYRIGMPCLLGIGKPIYGTAGNLVRVIILVFGLPLGFQYLGIPGAVIVAACSDFPVYLVITFGLWREKLGFLIQDIFGTLAYSGLTVLFLFVRSQLGFGFPFADMF